MGKRSRKRDRAPASVADAPPPKRPAAAAATGRRKPHRRPPLEERPKAPWDPFPLVELCVLLGIVIAVVGLFVVRGERGLVLLACGLVLCSLAGLDTAVREHFAGYRSHSTLLSGMVAVLVAGALFFARVPPIVAMGAGVIVFASAFAYFRSAFFRRAGVSWRA